MAVQHDAPARRRSAWPQGAARFRRRPATIRASAVARRRRFVLSARLVHAGGRRRTSLPRNSAAPTTASRLRCRACGECFGVGDELPAVALCPPCRSLETALPAPEVFLCEATAAPPSRSGVNLSERQLFGLDLYTREWLRSFVCLVKSRGTPSSGELEVHAGRLIEGQLRALSSGAESGRATVDIPTASEAPTPPAPPVSEPPPSRRTGAEDKPTTPSRPRPASADYAREHARKLGVATSRGRGNFWGATVRPEEQLLLATERGVWEPCYGVLTNAEWERRFGSRTSRKVLLPRVAAIHRRQASRGQTDRSGPAGACWVQTQRLVPFDAALLPRPVPEWVYFER